MSRRIRSGSGWSWLLVLLLAGAADPVQARPRVDAPALLLHDVPVTLTVSDSDLAPGESLTVTVEGVIGTPSAVLTGENPEAELEIAVAPGAKPVVRWEGGAEPVGGLVLPGWISVLPPLLAILLAIAFRQVILALMAGVWLGALLLAGGDPWAGFLRTFDTYVVGSLADRDHMSIVVFSFLLGGMLGVVTRSGGAAGIVGLVGTRATTRRGGQLTTWILGMVIFIDDYANSLLVGNTMRPLTDKLRISREKLAYLVDSTAAPVASIAVISTWIGVEVGLIQTAFAGLGIERDAYAVFLESIPYRFYPILALVFGLLVTLTGRDLGPMLRAERRAWRDGTPLRPGAVPLADFESGSLTPPDDRPHRWVNAVLPIAVVVLGVLVFIYVLGRRSTLEAGDALTLRNIAGNADSYAAILWASALGSLTAILLAVGQRVLRLREAMEAWVQGMKAILMAMLILTLAWAMGMVTTQMGTSAYLVQLLGDGLDPRWVPALVFVFSGFTAFATGSSWGTMGILMPLVIPLIHALAPGDAVALAGTISSVLAGSVWGDHCSPISDTTVLSSMASSSDHMDHVNTQLPYALLVGGVSIVLGDVATGFGAPLWLVWPISIALLWGVLRVAGRPVEA